MMRPPSYAKSELLGNAKEQKKRRKHTHDSSPALDATSHGQQKKPFKIHKQEDKLHRLPTFSRDYDPNLCYNDSYDGTEVKKGKFVNPP